MQTVTERADCAVQCSLLPGPPISLLKDKRAPGRDKDSDFDSQTEEEIEAGMGNESDIDYLCDETD